MAAQLRWILNSSINIAQISVLSASCFFLSSCSKNSYIRMLESDARSALGKTNGLGLYGAEIVRIFGECHDKEVLSGTKGPEERWVYWSFPIREVNMTAEKPRSIGLYFRDGKVIDVLYGY